MATCKYCGKSAGMFSHSHKECEEKHNQGITILEGAMRSYFRNTIQIGELKKVGATDKPCGAEWQRLTQKPHTNGT